MEDAGIKSMTAYLLRMALHGFVMVMDLSDLKEILRLLQIFGNNLNSMQRKQMKPGHISGRHRGTEKQPEGNIAENEKMLDKLTAIG